MEIIIVATDILFVVPDKESSNHFLYMRDGRIIQIVPFDGTVLGVAMLPSRDAQ